MKINMKKNIYKNRSIKTVFYSNKKQFSQFSKFQSSSLLRNWVLKKEFDKKVQNIDNNSPKKDIIQKEMIDCIDASKRIKSDLANIEHAQKAVEKISNNETPSKKEFTAYSNLKNQYQEHLGDTDSEDESVSESSSVEMVSPTQQSQKDKLNDLKLYLNSEYKSTLNSLNRLKNSFFRLFVGPPVEKETKRKIEESIDTPTEKKSRQSVHDFVENLPTDYNPLDDTGTD